MVQIEIYVSRGGATVPMAVVRLAPMEDVAKVVWSEKDPRGWEWTGSTVNPKGNVP